MDSTQKATFVASALRMLKERLDRLPDDTSRDEYFTARIEQTIEELEKKGITLTDSVADLMLVVDGAAWNHANRDKMTGQPEWLRKKTVGRWLNNDP